MGIGGASWKTDRKIQLGAGQDLSNIFNFGLNTAKAGMSAGQDLLGSAGSYYKNLLSGNRTSVTQAVAPETNAIRSGADATKRQIATSGTARGGGVAGLNQQINTDTSAKVDDAILKARPGAAAGAEKVGATQLSAALNALGISEKASSDLADVFTQARSADYKINQDMVGKVSQAALNILAEFV